MLSLTPVDRVRVTTVVDNYIDALRQDEKVARRFSAFVARQMPDLRAEHGLAHYVEVTRGGATTRIAFDFGPSETALTHNFRVLGLDAGAIDALALSHGHWDHFGGLGGFLRTYRRAMRKDLAFYGGEDHFLTRWNQRGADRVCMGRLHRDDIERHDVRVESVRAPLLIADGVLLSGEMHEQEPFEPIPENLRVERDGAVVPDSFIGEQTLIAHVRGRGLVVVTSCSHRGIVGICRHAARITGVPKVHAVIGGFHLSGLKEERVTRVVDAFRGLEVDWVVPQHCTGLEAMATMRTGCPPRTVVTFSSVEVHPSGHRALTLPSPLRGEGG
jgi:7,8-dihydropterin-6-yl-methyl-4-(beta-D-ribofuranosyl)aminobenzene 5'-phosphate synthase